MEALECAMNKLKKVIRFFTPRIETYIVLSSTANQIAVTTHQYSLPAEYELDYITSALRPSIERIALVTGVWPLATWMMDSKVFVFVLRAPLQPWAGSITIAIGD